MQQFQRKYYEQDILSDRQRFATEAEEERRQEIVRHLPPDANSILDVGCGNGHIMEAILSNPSITEPKQIVGIDISISAVRRACFPGSVADIASLPLGDCQFDLVTTFEVLEHLPIPTYQAAIRELKRVSRKYIMITVPNSEDIRNRTCMCPSCGCWFNAVFHMRAFTEMKLQELFSPEFRSITIQHTGTTEYRRYNKKLLSIYRAVSPPAPPSFAICPQCGWLGEEAASNNATKVNHSEAAWIRAIKTVVKPFFPMKKRKRWLLALYVR